MLTNKSIGAKKRNFLQKSNLTVNLCNTFYYFLYQFEQSAYTMIFSLETRNFFEEVTGLMMNSLFPK